jgi:hypothetical protein
VPRGGKRAGAGRKKGNTIITSGTSDKGGIRKACDSNRDTANSKEHCDGSTGKNEEKGRGDMSSVSHSFNQSLESKEIKESKESLHDQRIQDTSRTQPINSSGLKSQGSESKEIKEPGVLQESGSSNQSGGYALCGQQGQTFHKEIKEPEIKESKGDNLTFFYNLKNLESRFCGK